MENYLINNRLEEKFIDDLAINQRSQGNSKNNKKASKCCSCCCCCFSDKVEIHSLKYIKNWRMYLEKESILHTNDPFKILTSLWLDNSVTKELENIRLNPNLISTIRDDLEFYITQLCTYLIFGDSDSFDELVAFLCKASCACFYFAHRIIWFFMSLDEKEIDQGYNKKINGILNIIFNMLLFLI